MIGRRRRPTKRYSLLISDSPPLIWYRIPRAASHTTHALLRSLGVRASLSYSETEATVRADRRHEDPRYFKFAVVRSPWQRFLSTWNYFREKDPVLAAMTIDQFIHRLETDPELGLDPHVRPQKDLVAIEWERLDFIGRMERLSEDLGCLVRRCFPHVDPSAVRIRHLKASRRATAVEESELRTLKAYVEERYREDIRLLGYGERTDGPSSSASPVEPSPVCLGGETPPRTTT